MFSRLWKDTMTVYRYEEVTTNDVTTVKEKSTHTGVKCHYSRGGLTETGDGVPNINNSHMLFCPVEKVQEGDKVVVTQRNGKTIELSVGECFPFSGGMQCKVKRTDKA